MKKIYGYELKRFLFNKFFLGLLAVTLVYSWQVIRGDVVVGVASTAPFSPWSLGYYLASVLPVLLISLLFFVSFLFSAKEQRVRPLTDACPADPLRYRLSRCMAMITGYLILCAAVMAEGCVFNYRLFGFTGLGNMAMPALITLLPPMVLTLGLGTALGNRNGNLLYVLMAHLLTVSFLPLPYPLEIFGSRFFSEYPLELNILDPPFTVPLSVAAGRICLLLAGAFLLLIGLKNRPLDKPGRTMATD